MQYRSGVASFVLAATFSLAPFASVSAAEVASTASYDLPAQDLETSLNDVRRISGRNIVFDQETIEGHKAPRLVGSYSAEEAINRLVEGSGLRALVTKTAIMIGQGDGFREGDHVETSEQAITVTGSRIKGARIASPEIRIDREEIQRAGYGDLGEALRALPQNFGGGQNPGLGLGAAGGGLTNQNVTGGSAVNLRGIGADATLTLLNGHRLAFGGLAQGVDISAIPVDAIERVEIVPDGTSALYGSDAVAGVVNVILRHPFDGLSLRTRFGNSTDGGGFTQQYNAVLGQQWNRGGIVVAYAYRRDDKIEAIDRPYTQELGNPYPLLPGQSNHAITFHGRQDTAGGVEFSIDATYNKRNFTSKLMAFDILQIAKTDDETFAIAPSVALPVGSTWRLTTSAVYGKARTHNFTSGFAGEVPLYEAGACYCYSHYGLDAYFEGPVVNLLGGEARAVLGGGIRSNKYELVSQTAKRGGRESDRFLFGEISIPLAAPADERAWMREFRVTAAGRYDSYKLAGDVFTPRLGLAYSPSASFDFKFSWGRSFKAPILGDQFGQRGAVLQPSSVLGGSDAPADSTVLTLAGGSQDLRPERAATQTWTIDIHPASIPNLSVEMSYFKIGYKDRVLAPIGNYAESLNPAYAGSVIYDPTVEQVETAIAGTDFFYSLTGEPFDASKVAYIVDNYSRNVAEQRIEGVDFRIMYYAPLASGQVDLSASGSWLRSKQKDTPTAAFYELAGTAWHPPHWRGQASAGWTGAGFEIFAYANYIGGVEDHRVAPYSSGRSMTTFDLSIGYTVSSSSRWLDGIKAQFSVSNLFNQRPPYLRPAAYAEPYDSTNYSPVGRFIALSLSQTL
jgi:iron complex outermembrane receptor protein